MKINKLFIIFFILILGMGIASATDNQTICNNTGITSLEDANINVNVLSDQHEISHELQGNNGTLLYLKYKTKKMKTTPK